MVEMVVVRTDDELVFDRDRSDPDVVRGNRRSLSSELSVELGVVARRHLGGEDHVHAGHGQEALKYAFIFISTVADGEASPKLRDDHERNDDEVGVFDEVDHFVVATAHLTVGVRVERESHHLQIDSSICR